MGLKREDVVRSVMDSMPHNIPPSMEKKVSEWMRSGDTASLENIKLIGDMWLDSIDIADLIFDTCDSLGVDGGYISNFSNASTVGDVADKVIAASESERKFTEMHKSLYERLKGKGD